MSESDRKQLFIDLQYKQEPRDHPEVRLFIEQGYRVVHLQRVSDREAIVTVEVPASISS